MNADFLSEWLDRHIWPQVRTMILNDAYFQLMGRARELTGEFNGPIAGLIEVGYVTSQTLAIRRLCDGGRDVTSARGGQGEKPRSGHQNRSTLGSARFLRPHLWARE